MRIRLLSELFEPAPYRLLDSEATGDGYTARYAFEAGGNRYVVTCDRTTRDGQAPGPDSRYTMDVAFVLERPRDRNGQTVHTGIMKTGHASVVLGTVVAILRELVDSYPIEEIAFYADADEPSRRKVYTAIARRFAPDWNYRDHDGFVSMRKHRRTVLNGGRRVHDSSRATGSRYREKS